MKLEIQELTPDLWPALEQLFLLNEGCSGCWCYNHHIPPGTPDVTGEPAKQALKALVLSQKTHGALAFIQGKPVGWCALDRKKEIPGHDCVPKTSISESIWSIHCFYVHPEYRGHGVADQLLKKVLELATRYGATVIEGYPQPERIKKVPPEQSFAGPRTLYLKYGFESQEIVNDFYQRMLKKG